MQVNRYMSRPVVTVEPRTEFHMAYELMRQHRIHHLPVVEAGRVVGMIAERDVLLAAAHFGSAEVPVGEIMRHPVVCIPQSSTLAQAARKLVVKHIGSLPVLDSGKALVGIITETDVFKVMAGMVRGTKRKAPTKAGKSSKARGRRAAGRGRGA